MEHWKLGNSGARNSGATILFLRARPSQLIWAGTFMAYDLELAQRVAQLLKSRRGVAQRRMFGGVCFLLNGHMCCGIEKRRLMVRVGPAQYEAALGKPHARPMDFTGRPMNGFVFVMPEGLRTREALKGWVNLGVRYAASLPSKPRSA